MIKEKTIESFTLQEFLAVNPVKHNKWFVPHAAGDGRYSTVLSRKALSYLDDRGLHKFSAPGSDTNNRLPSAAWDILVEMGKDSDGRDEDDNVEIAKKIREDMNSISNIARSCVDALDAYLAAKEGGAK